MSALSSSGVIFMEDFDDGTAPVVVKAREEPEPEPEIIIPTFTAEELEAARQEAYADGMRAGHETAQRERGHQVRLILEHLERDFEKTRLELLGQTEIVAEELARSLLSCLYGSLPAFCREHAEFETRALIRQIMPGLAREPRLEIRVHPDVVEAVEEELKNLPQRLPELLTVKGDAKLEASDLRAVWDEGHLERNSREIWAEVKNELGLQNLLQPEVLTEEYHAA